MAAVIKQKIYDIEEIDIFASFVQSIPNLNCYDLNKEYPLDPEEEELIQLTTESDANEKKEKENLSRLKFILNESENKSAFFDSLYDTDWIDYLDSSTFQNEGVNLKQDFKALKDEVNSLESQIFQTSNVVFEAKTEFQDQLKQELNATTLLESYEKKFLELQQQNVFEQQINIQDEENLYTRELIEAQEQMNLIESHSRIQENLHDQALLEEQLLNQLMTNYEAVKKNILTKDDEIKKKDEQLEKMFQCYNKVNCALSGIVGLNLAFESETPFRLTLSFFPHFHPALMPNKDKLIIILDELGFPLKVEVDCDNALLHRIDYGNLIKKARTSDCFEIFYSLLIDELLS